MFMAFRKIYNLGLYVIGYANKNNILFRVFAKQAISKSCTFSRDTQREKEGGKKMYVFTFT